MTDVEEAITELTDHVKRMHDDGTLNWMEESWLISRIENVEHTLDHVEQHADDPSFKMRPITGSVRDYDFVDDGFLLVEVEDDDGVWYETYEFVMAEKSEEVPAR